MQHWTAQLWMVSELVIGLFNVGLSVLRLFINSPRKRSDFLTLGKCNNVEIGVFFYRRDPFLMEGRALEVSCPKGTTNLGQERTCSHTLKIHHHHRLPQS